MGQTCLQAGQLAAVIFGAIFGTLALAGAFLVGLWYLYMRNQKNESKMFYVERQQSVEFGEERPDSAEKNNKGGLSSKFEQLFTSKSITLAGHSHYKEPINETRTSAALGELGITINKTADSGVHVASVQKNDAHFQDGDRLNQLSVDLNQLSLEKAAALLELLTPYQVHIAVLRMNQHEVQVEPEHQSKSRAEEAKAVPEVSVVHEVHEHDEVKDVVQEVQELAAPPAFAKLDGPPEGPPPPPPIESPPASPTMSSRSSSMEEAETDPIVTSTSSAEEEVRVRATKIPTPKMSSRTALSTLNKPASTPTGALNDVSAKYNSYTVSCHATNNNHDDDGNKHALAVHSEETDEFGLTAEQYSTLENNRRRLEQERQQLRDLGILS